MSKYHQNADKSLIAIATSSTGQVSPLTISTTDLTLYEFAFLDVTSNVTEVYEEFEWNKEYSINNDHVGIAVPDGWNILSQSEVSTTYYETIADHNANDGFWVEKDFSGGRPDQIDLYGADWNYTTGVGVDGESPSYLYFKGEVGFKMKPNGSSAQKRAVGKYASVNGGWGSASISIGFGPASISYSPPSGWFSGIDTAGCDTSW